MSNVPVRIIQITDTHLRANENGVLLGVKTQESMQALLDLLRQNDEKMDFILHTGDMSQDGSKASYIRVSNLLKTFNSPVYYTPGNHDDVTAMNTVFPHEKICSNTHLLQNNWNIILLNSQIPGKVEGLLDTAQFEHMEKCLQKHPQQHAMIAFHHHPLRVGSAWLDNIGLKNAEEFWKVVARYPQIKLVLFGHVHQEFEQEMEGVKCYATPSTCIQFKPKQDEFGIEKLGPGYRWVELYEDGRILTGVKRVAEYIGVFDENAKGY